MTSLISESFLGGAVSLGWGCRDVSVHSTAGYDGQWQQRTDSSTALVLVVVVGAMFVSM
jgi:hypothetical protein